MSKRTANRKTEASGGMLTISEMNEIRFAMEMDELDRKRRQEKFDASPRRRKDGMPYQAHSRNRAGVDFAWTWRTKHR